MKKIALIILLLVNLKVYTQTVNNDLTFNQIGQAFDYGVEKILIQPNGKILVAGNFYSYNDVPRNGIARLNSDGTIDYSFNPSIMDVDLTQTLDIAIQADGKIVAVGYFGICRLNSDGTQDVGFNSSIVGVEVPTVAVQSDGKIVIGGNFNNHIARLNADGSFDLSFNPGSGFQTNGLTLTLETISIQADGKILVGGYFTSFNMTSRNNITRLNADGTLDATFNPGSGFDYGVFTSSIQIDGKIILGGEFISYNGTSRSGIARLNPDGTIDTSFDPGGGFVPSPGFPSGHRVCTSSIQTDGKIVLGGSFSGYNGNLRIAIVRLNQDGTLDTTFDPSSSFNGDVLTTSIQSDGKIIAGGYFTNFRGFQRGKITRLRMDCNNSNAINNTINISSCAPYISPGNESYSQPGTYFETLLTSIGCDSVYLTINLDILPNSTGSFDATFCFGASYFWNNIEYSEPGIYQQTLTNQYGCDSVVTLNLMVIPNNFNPTFSSTNQLYTAPPFAVQFTNSTANVANYSFTWDFGDGTTLASNNASVFHQYLYNGQYTVSLIATSNTTGCTDTTTLSDYIFCTGGVSCTHTAAISQTSPQQVCQGTPLWLSCNNDPSFSYQWRRNGVIISGNNNDSLQVTQSGTYSVIISVNNCPVISSDVVVNILPAPATPVITSSGAIQPCLGGSVTLNAGSYASYNWSTGSTTQSINVSSSGTYSVSVTGANSCSATSAPFNVNASFVAPPQVCIVGMDSLTNENRIVWEKPITLGIDSFYVYKESNVSNVYTKIGATNYNDLAVFLDVNSNPAVQAYRYKISALDTCGVETNVGDFHKTIHLTINQGVGGAWNLIWSHYEGLTFGSYNIYRGTSLSNMALLTTIQSNLNSYTDLTPPSGAVYYQIEIVNPVNCDPTKSINYGISRSNIVNNGQVGIEEEFISSMQVYPNPTNDKLTLGVSNDLLGKQYVITDFSGRMILQGKIHTLNQIIELTNVSNGSYLLKVDNSNAKAIKIVKQ